MRTLRTSADAQATPFLETITQLGFRQNLSYTYKGRKGTEGTK